MTTLIALDFQIAQLRLSAVYKVDPNITKPGEMIVMIPPVNPFTGRRYYMKLFVVHPQDRDLFVELAKRKELPVIELSDALRIERADMERTMAERAAQSI